MVLSDEKYHGICEHGTDEHLLSVILKFVAKMLGVAIIVLFVAFGLLKLLVMKTEGKLYDGNGREIFKNVEMKQVRG